MIAPAKSALLSALLLSSGSALAASSSTPTVELSNGVVKGTTCSGTGVKRYRGIPYAQSPAGSNRFLPPKAFNGTLGDKSNPFDATQPAAPCLQYNLEFGVRSPNASEDCLTVDVYVPADATKDSNLPVKVWSYGGFNEAGGTSDPLYDACRLATDAIVVEYNYRVGPMGFLSLPSAGIAGNMAIQDGVAALEWVQHNAAAFGGDKSHVVIFGQSAGANNIFTIATLPQAPQLLKGVVVQSGGGTFVTPAKVAQEAGARFARALNCTSSNVQQQLSCLQSSDPKVIAKVYADIPTTKNISGETQIPGSIYAIANPYKMDISSAVLDGKIVAEEPLATGPKVPILAGGAQRDAALLVIPYLLHADKNFTSQDYYEYLKYWGENNAAKIAKRYPLSMFNQTGSTNQAVYAALTTITTVSRLLCTSYYVMRSAEAAGVASYMYRWNHTLSCPFDIVPTVGPFPSAEERPLFGPTHISDVPFAFGNLDRMPLGNGSCNATSAEHALSKTMRASWTAMANGDPSASGLKWPRYNACSSKGVVFEDEAKVETIGNSECQFWGEAWKDITGSSIPFLGEKPSCSGNNSTAPSGGASGTSGSPSQSPSAHIAAASVAESWTRLHAAVCVAVVVALLL